MLRPPPPKSGEKQWLKILARYRQPDRSRSIFELIVTVVPFLVLWGLAIAMAEAHIWWGLALVIPAAGFLLRIFMIQHDCGHGSFFAMRRADDWTGRVPRRAHHDPLRLLKSDHAVHHATAGNLDERGAGDIDTLTVAEYRALSSLGKLRYRLYRNPFVMFGIGPIYLFMFKHRWPFPTFNVSGKPWLSVTLTNLAIAAFFAGMIWWTGVMPFLLVHLPIVALAGGRWHLAVLRTAPV
jgi:omega-6 fatty acid desaturase (delta-12 desaturase)